MRILDRYIVREIFRHAFLGLVVFTFVLFVPQLVRLMELLVRHSGSGSQITKLFLYIFPGVLIFTIPMAVLVGVLLGLGRMSADSEIIALTALGISRQRMLVPVGVLALTGAIATGTLTLWLAPAAFRALDRKSTRLNSSHANISYAVFCLKKKKLGRWPACRWLSSTRRSGPSKRRSPPSSRAPRRRTGSADTPSPSRATACCRSARLAMR